MMEGDRVLLVDDEEDFLEALAKRLRARGLKVETSDDGKEARRAMRDKRKPVFTGR